MSFTVEAAILDSTCCTGVYALTGYQRRLFNLLDYLDSHLDQTLTTDSLSQIACSSRFHFHRQFAALFGINVGSYIRVLKFKRAAYLLAYRETSVMEIGLSLGYESGEAFSRAFKQYCQQSPSDFRLNPQWVLLNEQEEYLIKIRKTSMQNISDTVEYTVEIVELAELDLAVMEHKGNPQLLGDTIRQFIGWRKENKLPPNQYRTFNLVYNDPDLVPEDEYRFDLAVEYKSPLPMDCKMVAGKIPAGRYALIRYSGEDAGLRQAVDYLYRDWLTNHDVELRDFPLVFERILFYPDLPETQQIVHIYLPLQ